MTASGVKRIARGRDVSGEDQTPIQASAAKPLRVLDDADAVILVCLHAKSGELSTLDREVAYVARALAELRGRTEVALVLFGELSDDSILAESGIDQVMVVANADHYAPEDKVAAVSAEYRRLSPAHVLFAESQHGDSDLARRFAVRAGLGIATDVFEVSEQGVRRGCGNGRFQAEAGLPAVLVLQSGTTGALDLEFTTQANAQQRALDSQPDEHRFSLPSQDIPLVEADFVISAGNGVTNMDTFHALAEALGATVGGSRVVVDDGKLPRERQVGATGQIVRAQVYLAIGISGAVQHLQGIKECSTVIAVNHDPSCDMVKRADLSIIADAQSWMESMLTSLNAGDRS